MKKQIKASKLNFDFFDWYNNILTDKQQRDVDDTADELGYPEYDECSDNQLSKIFYRWAKTRYNSNERSRRFMQRELVEASADPTHTYIVKIWHEVEANPESMYLPEAAEEIFEIVANSPQAAMDMAKRQWSGPIDRIEIIDIDPDPDTYKEDLPFDANTDITASSSKTEDEWRAEYFSPENYPNIDPQRLADLLAVNWNGITAEDSEYFVSEFELFPNFSVIESIDYPDDDIWNQIVDDVEYAGVYTVKYKDGSIRYYAWREYPRNDEMVDVTDLVTGRAIEGNTGIVADDSTVNTSAVSFDFIHDGDYNGDEILNAVMEVLIENGVDPLGGSFESVDYSGYPEYADETVSQCSVDFEWADDYDADAIEDAIEIALLPYEVIGVQFYAVGE